MPANKVKGECISCGRKSETEVCMHCFFSYDFKKYEQPVTMRLKPQATQVNSVDWTRSESERASISERAPIHEAIEPVESFEVDHFPSSDESESGFKFHLNNLISKISRYS